MILLKSSSLHSSLSELIIYFMIYALRISECINMQAFIESLCNRSQSQSYPKKIHLFASTPYDNLNKLIF